MTSNTTNLGASSPLPEGGKSLRIPVGMGAHVTGTVSVVGRFVSDAICTETNSKGTKAAGKCTEQLEDGSGLPTVV